MRANEIDITGKRFGRLVCIGRSKEKYISPKGEIREKWDFQCDCGKVKTTYKGAVTDGRTKSCGCLLSERAKNTAKMLAARAFDKWEKYKGRKFNRLTIESFSHVTYCHSYMYVIRCDCGKVRTMKISRVVSGEYESCGCMSGMKRSKTHKKLVQDRQKVTLQVGHPLGSLFSQPAIRTTKATYTHKMD